MDEKLLEAIVAQLGSIAGNLAALSSRVATTFERVDKFAADLEDFAQRFDEAVTQMENDRRADWQQFN